MAHHESTEGATTGIDGTDVQSKCISDPPIPISFIYKRGDVVAGRYRLKQVLGQGGVGMVWRAHDETLDIDVALKLIHGEMLLEETADRLLREARAAAKIDHPAIVRVLDFGTSDIGEPFIVMELLEGEDLRTAQERQGRWDPVEAVRTLLPIAHALDLAHSHGIVHRDVKPENIVLAKKVGAGRQPKLLDFGIAKVDQANEVRLTRTGAMLGSPSYMAPEQARGDEADHRADIWSLCVVLYEMVAVNTPFGGDNKNAILHSIITKEPRPLTELATGVEELWSIVCVGLSKNPDKRWQTVTELIEALCSWLVARGVNEDITGGVLAPAKFESLRNPFSTFPPPPLARSVTETTTIDSSERVARRRNVRLAALAGVLLGSLLLGLGYFHDRVAAKTATPAPLQGASLRHPPNAPVAEGPSPTTNAVAAGEAQSPQASRADSTPTPERADTVDPEKDSPESTTPTGVRIERKARRAVGTTEPPKRKLRDPFQ